jgi:hypothetical protein
MDPMYHTENSIAVRWAVRRAAASQTGGDGAAWLDGKPD